MTTHLVRVAPRHKASSKCLKRTRRVATRLAVLGSFHLRRCTATRQAHLRSRSGHNACVALAHAPTIPESSVPPLLLRVLFLKRLQLPLPITEAACEGCGDALDSLGRHRAACPRTGRLKKRATPIERMVARFFSGGRRSVVIQRTFSVT